MTSTWSFEKELKVLATVVSVQGNNGGPDFFFFLLPNTRLVINRLKRQGR